MLGAPVAETGTNFKYRYRNLYVEAESEDGTTIDSVTLVLPSVAEGDTFEIHPIDSVQYPEEDFVLGETRGGCDWRERRPRNQCLFKKWKRGGC